MFIDSAKIYVKAGNGGNGIVSFHKEKYVNRGGPDGGDGGKGGNIVFIADIGIKTLSDFRYKKHYKAESGQNGRSCNCSGRGGKDLIIKVPVGTIIKDEQTSKLIADFTHSGQKIIIAKGGKGGAGNQHFATPTRQIPTFAKPGDEGKELWILLELKLLADVGLVGYPNAGKSTILSMVSAAKPKIANYPFTTIAPNLGVVNAHEGKSFVLADIPGLIEGAHDGTGLGHDFLKHIERTRLLVHVVDIASLDGRDPLEDFKIINNELASYNPILASRPQIVAANKIDIPEYEDTLNRFINALNKMGYEVFPISAATNKGLDKLISYISKKLDEIPSSNYSSTIDEPVDHMTYTVASEPEFRIRRENDIYVIEGEWIKKFISSINFNDNDSIKYFQRVIKNKGINTDLEDMGIKEGDTVRIYDIEFEYVK